MVTILKSVCHQTILFCFHHKVVDEMMNKVFVFKHFWDENLSETKLLPEWLNAPDKQLSSAQVKTKKIVSELLTPSRYVGYSLLKQEVGEDSIYGYYIYYKTEKRDDTEVTNNRKVTNIVFCISNKPIDTKRCSWKISETNTIQTRRSLLTAIKAIVLPSLVLSIIFVLVDKNEIKVEDESLIKEGVALPKLPIPQEQIKLENSRFVNNMCHDIFKEIMQKKRADYCFEIYIQDRCYDKTKSSYDVWLRDIKQTRTNKICTFVIESRKDRDFLLYLKNNKTRTSIRHFMRAEEL